MVYKITFNDPNPPTDTLDLKTVLTIYEWPHELPLKHKFILKKSGFVYTYPFTLVIDYHFSQPVESDSIYNIFYNEIPSLIRNKKIQEIIE